MIATIALLAACAFAAEDAPKPVNIGSRLELMVDDFLIDSMTGRARLQLHRPTRGEIVFRTDAAWEGNASAYQSVFKDGDLYKMYYRGLHYTNGGKPAQTRPAHEQVLCYAESDDGIHWRRPKLGICEFDGSKDNNIIVNPKLVEAIGGSPAHTATFKDANPNCPADEKYKIVIAAWKPRKGLFLLKSADGIHFSIMTKEPIATYGAFDSQNLAFWDSARQEYREYHRLGRNGVRGIMTAASKDIRHFPEPKWLEYPGAPVQALYTNQVQPYYRAPHILMGFPMRYNDRLWSIPMIDLPGIEERLTRAKGSRRYGTTVTDAVFMTSRDRVTFKRWAEAFIRPGPRQRDTWVYGDNFVFWGMVETKSHLQDAPNEISLYATEGYWEGTYTSVRRYTLRIDGFVSAHAQFSGGEIVTKPIVFDGGNLALNMSTSAAGSIQVEIQDAAGKPIEDYTLDDCEPIFCDSLRYIVNWRYPGGDVRKFAGKPVRLRFVLKDADLYAFQFVPYQPDPKRPDVSSVGGVPRKNRERKPFVAIKDDFQNAPAGQTGSADDLDPLVADGKTTWFVAEGSPDRVQVLDDDPVGSGKAGKNHYVKAERRKGEHRKDGGGLWLKFLPQDASDSEKGIVEVEAKVYQPKTNPYCVDIDAFDNEPDKFAERAFQVRFFPNGRVTYYTDDWHTVEGLTIKADAWQSVAIRADLKAATFDLTVEGKTAKGLPFADAKVHRIQCIGFCPNTSGCTLYVDDVEVRVRP